jgi:hypothetical protein
MLRLVSLEKRFCKNLVARNPFFAQQIIDIVNHFLITTKIVYPIRTHFIFLYYNPPMFP